MPKSASKTATQPKEETRQQVQQRLVKEAAQHAGVAETMEVYGRLARYGGTVGTGPPTIRQASGGNSRT